LEKIVMSKSKKSSRKITDIIAEELRAGALPPTPPPAPPKPLVNHVLLALDDSGSMSGCFDTAVKKVNDLIAQLKQKAKETGQITTLSLWTFGDYVNRKFTRVAIEEVQPLQFYYPHSSYTTLVDAMGDAAEAGRLFPDANDENVSFLSITVTDGGENRSLRWGGRYAAPLLVNLLNGLQQTDRWTFSAMVPPGYKQSMSHYGIPLGNITEWTNDRAGTERVFAQTNASLDSYYVSRSVGHKSVKNFYTTDLSNLSKTELSKMDDVSYRFRKWNVDREVDIKTFVEAHGITFFIGAGYYAVTKKEQLRSGRNVLVREKGTNRIFGGQQARTLLGIPAGEVFVTPGNHANFDVFFQSTSVNRRLVRGTELLWDKSQAADSALGETWDSAAAKAAADAKALAAGQQPTP
jgi:hypothetical protein